MSLRDDLRSALSATPAFKSTKVVVDGREIEIREPTVKDRAAIFRAAKIPGTGEFDNARVQVEAVMACAFVPGTQEKVFEVADLDMLLAQPVGGWFDDLQVAAMTFINGSAAAAKNSKATASGK
jgi:hypothetical protein